MSYEINQNQTAEPLMFLMIDSADHLAGKAGLSPTVTISKNGAAFGAPAGAVTEISSGWYKVAGNATDANTLGPLALHATSAGADATDVLYRVRDSMATELANGTVGVVGTVNALAANAITAASIDVGAITELRAVASGASDSGTTTTMVDAARNEADTDYWAGDIILFTSGNIVGQARIITGFTPGTDTITFTPATTQAVGTHSYEILPGARAVLAGITHTLARVPNVTLADTVTTYTGNTPQTGDSFPKANSLTFTVAGQVDSNVQSINDVTITGDGQVGTEFGV